jgi:hypothetical protein
VAANNEANSDDRFPLVLLFEAVVVDDFVVSVVVVVVFANDLY